MSVIDYEVTFAYNNKINQHMILQTHDQPAI